MRPYSVSACFVETTRTRRRMSKVNLGGPTLVNLGAAVAVHGVQETLLPHMPPPPCNISAQRATVILAGVATKKWNGKGAHTNIRSCAFFESPRQVRRRWRAQSYNRGGSNRVLKGRI